MRVRACACVRVCSADAQCSMLPLGCIGRHRTLLACCTWMLLRLHRSPVQKRAEVHFPDGPDGVEGRAGPTPAALQLRSS
eukprot:1671360-Alexandrium_andersonii.AAC.1